jgi:hypothetical protein
MYPGGAPEVQIGLGRVSSDAFVLYEIVDGSIAIFQAVKLLI